MNSRPLSLSHGWAGRRIELRLTCNLQLQIVLPASSCFACLYQGGNLKLGFYAKICLIQNQYEDIVIYQILLYIQCISSA